jgi:transposase
MVVSSLTDWRGRGPRQHARYPKSITEYAAIYKVSPGAIGYWIRRGKENGELPPLENRAAMREWIRRHYQTRWNARYTKSHAEYADVYQVDPRTIKRWIRKGKLIGELPPLDNVAAMQRWLARRMPAHFSKMQETPKAESEQRTLPFDT